MDEERPKKKRARRQVRRKGNVRTWAKWTLRQIVGRTFRAMAVTRPKARVDAMIGYDRIQFIAHLEGLFQDEMSWERIDEIHIDHVIPLKWFIQNGIHRPEIINDLSNLEPIWAKDNLRKSSALPPDFEERLTKLLQKHDYPHPNA
jgi:hypothetical protein